MTFRLHIPGRAELQADTAAKVANLRIEDDQIRRFAGFAAPEACNAESMRERSAVISADGAPTWQADAMAGLLPWTEREIELFVKRQARIAWLGYGGASEYLAEKLVNRDRDQDDRRLCVECSHCGPGYRCGRNAGFMLEQLQRCSEFKESNR